MDLEQKGDAVFPLMYERLDPVMKHDRSVVHGHVYASFLQLKLADKAKRQYCRMRRYRDRLRKMLKTEIYRVFLDYPQNTIGVQVVDQGLVFDGVMLRTKM